MSKFFKICGLLDFTACLILFIVFLLQDEGGFSVVSSLLGTVNALALVAVGDLMDRVDNLESREEGSPAGGKTEPQIQQRKCPNCGKWYDIDSAKCPYCGWENGRIWKN